MLTDIVGSRAYGMGAHWGVGAVFALPVSKGFLPGQDLVGFRR
jgi:hypothetical protein